jgi:hypothetical protein
MNCSHPPLEDLEHRVMDHVRLACPTAQWIGSYAVLGPYDYLDIFKAESVDDASKISAIVRTCGHAHTELWPLTEWTRFRSLIRELEPMRASDGNTMACCRVRASATFRRDP